MRNPVIEQIRERIAIKEAVSTDDMQILLLLAIYDKLVDLETAGLQIVMDDRGAQRRDKRRKDS